MQDPGEFRTEGTGAPLLAPDYTQKAKKDFLMLGIGLLLFIGVSSVIQILVQSLTAVFLPELSSEPWYLWTLSLVPLYAVGFPLLLLLFRTVPAEKREKKNMPWYVWFGVFTVSVFVMYVGNFIGTVVTTFISLFKGSSVTPAIIDMLENSGTVWTVFAVVIAAPVMEELICRKLVIDRVRRYGELTAALFSATAFGMIHGNFSQFFYAFGLGFIFAWVYLKTGRVIYTMLLHASINLLGGVIGPMILRNVNMDALNESDPQKILEYLVSGGLREMAPLFLYTGVMLSMALVGAILLLIFRKKIVFLPAEEPIEKGKRFKTVYLNIGVALFILFCLGLFVLSILQ